ncbi:hypothetical protein B0T26DRAFT_748314 [Lasiosphaeria miniovina]|uniref:Uncharacterized protein n=1 Tax=Lasiosphaeria miniovina TaxID=1954250 RepID=A0AA40B5S7_9PEZI|nr:uncharacterized protein B0T26DRAFT_748314 [Lasiosphaeria miniovina]KAK0728042.1 hypothetical protein B0T26DRAFT_748314 [Lasiosphaeria miniovina]
MCHFATFHFGGCGDWALFLLHCQYQTSGQLCEGSRRDVVARYWTRLRCLDCHNAEWDKVDEDRLASIDDELAHYARESAAGTLSSKHRSRLVAKLEREDGDMESKASRSRAYQEKVLLHARNWSRRHAMALWNCHYGKGLAGITLAQLQLTRPQLVRIETKLPLKEPQRLLAHKTCTTRPGEQLRKLGANRFAREMMRKTACRGALTLHLAKSPSPLTSPALAQASGPGQAAD